MPLIGAVSFTDLQTSSTTEQNAPTQTTGTPTKLTKLTSMATIFRPRTATTTKPEVMVITTLSTQPPQSPLPSPPPTTKKASLTTLKPQVVITSKLKDSNAFHTSKITIDTVIPQIKKTIGILPSLHIVIRSSTSSLQTPALHSFVKTSQTSVTPSQVSATENVLLMCNLGKFLLWGQFRLRAVSYFSFAINFTFSLAARLSEERRTIAIAHGLVSVYYYHNSF